VAWFDLQVDGGTETVDITSTGGVVIAPAGDRIAHVSRARETGMVSLWVRRLGEPEGRAAVSGPVVMQPFFSPDGSWVGYFGDGMLTKVVVAGGSPIEIAPASNPRGASWGSDGSIVFSPNTNSPLLRVSAAGGNIEAVTELDAERRERSHRWPAFLPGRSDLLVFTSETVDQDFSESSIELLDLRSGERRVLVESASYGSVTTDGTLLFARDSNLYGARLASDFSSLETEPLPVAYGINFSTSNGHATVSVSDNGLLILADSMNVDGPLAGLGVSWITLSGAETALDWLPGVVSARPAISPDGTRVAFHTLLSQSRVQIYDLERGVASTPYPGEYYQESVVWSPAGNRIAFASTTADSKIPSLVVAALDSAEPPRKLTTAIVDPHSPSSWSVRDEILFVDRREETGLDLLIYDLTTDEVRDVVATAGEDHSGHFSPDGDWVAFVSDVGGSGEIYVTKREGGRRWQVSADQGRSPRWSPEGDAVYFLVDAAGFERSLLMRAAFSVENDVPELSLPEALTEFSLNQGTNTEMWDLHPDGTRLISIRSKIPGFDFTPKVRLALNWFTELNQLLDAAGPS
jgi:Tol biopolymer transport system component